MAADQIRVVNATQHAADVFSFGEKELQTVLADLAQTSAPVSADPGDRAANRRAFESFGKLAREMKKRAVEEALPKAVPMISTRQVLYDQGVVPLGKNVIGSRERLRAREDAGGADFVRPPLPKEVWQDAPPSKKLIGQSPVAQMTAAAPEDRLEVEAMVVLPAALGRGSTYKPTAPTEKRSYLLAMARGEISEAILPQVGKMLLQARRISARLSHQKGKARKAVLSDLQLIEMGVTGIDPLSPWFESLARVLSGAFAGYKNAAEEYPELKKGRLDPSTYTSRALVGSAGPRPDAWVVHPDELAALSNHLNSIYHQVRTGVMGTVGLLCVPPVERASATQPETKETPISAMVSPETGGVANVYPLVGRVLSGTGPEKEYAKALEILLAEILKARGIPQHQSSVPLNFASEIYPEFSLNPVRDFLAGTVEGQERVDSFLMRLRQDRKNKELLESLEDRTRQQMVKARQYLVITEEKLGGARYAQVIKLILTDPVKYDIDNPRDVLMAIRATASKGKEKTDSSLVMETYRNLLEEWALQTKNTCPHLKLASSLRSEQALDRKRHLLGKLKAFLPDTHRQGATTWIDCKSCKFRAICPHVLVLLDLEFRQATYAEIKSALRPFASEVTFAPTSMTPNYAFYCKICSEELYVQVPDGIDTASLGRVGDMDSGLKQYLWQVMMGIITGNEVRRVKGVPVIRFDRPMNPSRFSSEAADVCHPLVVLAKTSAKYRKIRRKGNVDPSPDTLNPYDRLLGVIYLYAYLFGLALGVPPKMADEANQVRLADLVHVIVESGDESSRGATRRGKPAPDVVAKTLLTHLVRTQPLLLSQLEGVTNEQIANQFQDSYGHIQDTYGRLRVTQQDSVRLFVTELTLTDPFFTLLKKAEHSDGAPAKDFTEAREAIKFLERVMGASLQDMLSDRFLLEEAKEHAPFVRTILARRGGIEYPASVLREKGAGWVYHSPEIRLYRKAKSVVNNRALKYWQRIKANLPRRGGEETGRCPSPTLIPVSALMADNVQPPVAAFVGGKAAKKKPQLLSRDLKTRAGVGDGQRPVSPPKGESLYQDALNLTILYSTWVHDDDTFKQYLEYLDLATKRETRFRENAKFAKVVPENNFLWLGTSTRQIRDVGLANVSKLYDEDGNEHVWDRYLWENEKGDQQVLTRKEIEGLLEGALDSDEPSPLAGFKSVDWVCGTCGVRWSETDKLSDAKVYKQLHIKSRLKAFFLYFESRCPKGGLHDFGDKSACQKCGVETQLLTAAGRIGRDEESNAYYEKYSAVLGVAMTGSVSNQHASTPRLARGATPRTASKKAAMPERDFDKVLELAKMLEAAKFRGAQTLIQSMGGMEGLTIEEVHEGQMQDPPESIEDPRLLAADNNVRELLNTYCRFYFRQKARGGGNTKYSSPSELDGKGAYFKMREEAIAGAREAKDSEQKAKWALAILNLSIDSFCGLAVKILKQGGKDQADAAELQSIVKNILHRESMFTNHGEFQWSVFGDADDTRGMSHEDSTGDDVRRYGPASSGSEDVLAQKEKEYAKDAPGSEDRFSFDAVDIDRATVEANLDN